MEVRTDPPRTNRIESTSSVAASQGSCTWWSAFPSAPLRTTTGSSARTKSAASVRPAPSLRRAKAANAKVHATLSTGPTQAAPHSGDPVESATAAATNQVCSEGQAIRAPSGKFTQGSNEVNRGKDSS